MEPKGAAAEKRRNRIRLHARRSQREADDRRRRTPKPLEELFRKLGVNPLELLGLLKGQGGEGLGGLLEGITGAGGELLEGGRMLGGSESAARRPSSNA